MKRIIKGLATACIYAVAIGSVMAAENSSYISGMLTYIDDDAIRLIDDQFGGFRVGYGRAFRDKVDLEINAFGGIWDGFQDSEEWGAGLDAHLLLSEDRDAKIVPYFIMGTGFMKTQNAITTDSSGLIGSLGIGADMRIKPGVSFRADLRGRRDFSSPSSPTDILFNFGFKMDLGKTAPPPPADSDADGVHDDIDRCPNTPAGIAVDSSGCELDGDVDGVVDRRDRCPSTRRGADVDSRGCEIVSDADGDGVPDGRDRCPDSLAGAKVDANGCEFDSDADGVVDRLDRCSDTSAGTRVDSRGCPLQRETRLDGVLFEINSAQLSGDSVRRLNQAVETLKLNPDLKVEVAGHTDSTGAASYNEQMSQRRAEAVRDYLVSNGIGADRLSARGYGESQPVGSNETREGRAENRRVTLRILNEDM